MKKLDLKWEPVAAPPGLLGQEAYRTVLVVRQILKLGGQCRIWRTVGFLRKFSSKLTNGLRAEGSGLGSSGGISERLPISQPIAKCPSRPSKQ
jgi:hypothetical protein